MAPPIAPPCYRVPAGAGRVRRAIAWLVTPIGQQLPMQMPMPTPTPANENLPA